MKKKILLGLVMVMMVLPIGLVLAGCSNDDAKRIDVNVNREAILGTWIVVHNFGMGDIHNTWKFSNPNELATWNEQGQQGHSFRTWSMNEDVLEIKNISNDIGIGSGIVTFSNNNNTLTFVRTPEASQGRGHLVFMRATEGQAFVNEQTKNIERQKQLISGVWQVSTIHGNTVGTWVIDGNMRQLISTEEIFDLVPGIFEFELSNGGITMRIIRDHNSVIGQIALSNNNNTLTFVKQTATTMSDMLILNRKV